jgi:hypothetical protein
MYISEVGVATFFLSPLIANPLIYFGVHSIYVCHEHNINMDIKMFIYIYTYVYVQKHIHVHGHGHWHGHDDDTDIDNDTGMNTGRETGHAGNCQ